MQRSGGLMLCECEHVMNGHQSWPAWYFHEGSSEAAKACPMLPPTCSQCGCTEPRVGKFQGFRLQQSANAGSEHAG